MQKNDIVIEHGHMGKYQALPEAELISVRVNPADPTKLGGSWRSRRPPTIRDSCKRMSRSGDASKMIPTFSISL